MAWASIPLIPGVNAELTPTALQAGYSSTSLGRFKSGMFQKIGGWAKYISYSVGGVPKCMNAWQSIAGSKYLGIGTTTELDVFASGAEQSITPQTTTTNVTANFTTTAGSPVVTVIDSAISTITPFCSVFFNTPVTIDGIILSGAYPIANTLSSTSYTILASSSGLAGVSNGGAVPAFTTTNANSSVKVTLANHGLSIGSDIVFPLSTTVGGIAISGRYVVTSVTDSSNFYITVANTASSGAGPTSMNSGKAGFLYYIAGGPTPSVAGYGTGNYGAGAYGVGVSSPGQSGTPITSTDWTLSNWGEDLIACTENGGIYYWPPSGGIQNGILLPNAPVFNAGAFVSTSQQMIIAYGSSVISSIGTYQDPLTIRWCDIQNFTSWYPTVTNQAGSFRLPTGSRIIAGAATPARNLIWTDIELWGMSYIGTPFVFSTVRIGSNCGIMGKHAFTQLADNVYWLGSNNFFVLSGGGVSVLPCPVWDVLYQDLDTANAGKCFAASNALFSEVWFFYPSKSDNLGFPSRYVKFNTSEGTWDFGSLQRNCWMDQTVLGYPMACTNSGVVYSQETTADNDGSPITSSFTTGYFFVNEGEQFVFIDKIIPDFKFGPYAASQNAVLSITINAIDDISDTPRTYGPYPMTSASPYVDVRIRARQVSITIKSSDNGSFWRLGHIRFRYSPDGRR